MSIYQFRPRAPLDQHIDWFWYYDDFRPDHAREHVLPDGTFELIINLEERPRKLFDREDANRFDSFKRGWISGAHAEYLVIDALPASSMMGAHFKPGGAKLFLGLPADELRSEVVELDDLWGSRIWDWRQRLLDAAGPRNKFRVLEAFLLQRLSEASGRQSPRQNIRWAVERFIAEPQIRAIGDAASALGVSHKHFIQQFRREVGLTPKLFCRIRRFQQVLGAIQSRKTVEWADVAFDCGYFDQAHFINDFKAFAGLNPSAYLRHRLEGETKFARAIE